MKNDETIKVMVKEKYGAIANQSKAQNQSSCCGGTCGSSNVEFSIMSEDYSQVPGYVPEADLALGCGIPTDFARIKPGDTVVDLGSGAGNDCFVARSITGEKGRVIGIDMTEPMIEKARENARKLEFTNVEFLLGEIEALPLPDSVADVVVSNCVLNLVPNKPKAFAEMHRILKPGGHFCVSDIVLRGELPEGLRDDAVMYAGCISGAQQKDGYLGNIVRAGFTNVVVQKERRIDLPREILERHLTAEQQDAFSRETVGVFSLTVYADKP